jgi:hypothetical protein
MTVLEQLIHLRDRVRAMRRAQTAVSKSDLDFDADELDALVRTCIELEDEVDKLICPTEIL